LSPGAVLGTVEVTDAHERKAHSVLTLTENANHVVKTIVDQSAQAAPSGDPNQAGLRISQDEPDSPALHVMPTEAPQPGDQVLEEQEGARVFLEETAAITLGDKVLDAQIDDNGGVQFSIAPQA
jgi:iron-sulfur cluster assembly protein